MTIKKNILVGLLDGISTGVYLPGYLTKRISGRNFYSHGEAIDAGKLTDKDIDRTSLEYQIVKGIGDVLGVACGATNLFLIGIAFDIKQNRNLRKKAGTPKLNKLETELREPQKKESPKGCAKEYNSSTGRDEFVGENEEVLGIADKNAPQIVIGVHREYDTRSGETILVDRNGIRVGRVTKFQERMDDLLAEIRVKRIYGDY